MFYRAIYQCKGPYEVIKLPTIGDIFSIILHSVRVEASFSLGQDVVGWRQSKTTGETLREKVVLRRFARANKGIVVGPDPEWDHANTENNSEMKNEVEERKVHRMAKVHDDLEMWQGSQNLCVTQKESRTQNRQMTAVGYISDTEELIKASWSLFQHDGVAAFILSQRSPLPPPLSAKDLPGGQTQILNVCRIWKINHHPGECDEGSASGSISDTKDCLNWNRDLDNPDDTEDDCVAHIESDLDQDNSNKDPDCPVPRDVSAAPNVPRWIQPTGKSSRNAEKVLVTVKGIETRWNKGVNTK